jgi:hypothetical protein
MRIKAHWFKPEQAKSPEQRASAVAFIAWRVAIDVVKRLRAAGFDVDIGPAYFSVVRELLVFLLTGADRLAYARLGADERVPFTRPWRRVSGSWPTTRPICKRYCADMPTFVDQFNTLAEHYANWLGHGEGDDGPITPTCATSAAGSSRCCRRTAGGSPSRSSRSRRRAVDLVRRAMDGVFSTEPRK